MALGLTSFLSGDIRRIISQSATMIPPSSSMTTPCGYEEQLEGLLVG